MGEPPRKEARLQKDIGGDEQVPAISEIERDEPLRTTNVYIKAEEMVERTVKEAEPESTNMNDVKDPVLQSVYESSVKNIFSTIYGRHTDIDSMMDVESSSDKKRHNSWSSSAPSDTTSPDNIRHSQQTRENGRG